MRQDIQFLRGFAVLSVLLYHADIVHVRGGYLGVDIFFVISGYLITSIILRDLDNHQFSFSHFYLRRAKRLLPAAYSTLIFSTLLGYAFLTKGQWDDYIEQLIGTVTFTANFILPFQTGYFENAAAGKPLLHTWSLSLEEQYYLVTPFLLFMIPPRWRGWAFGGGMVASFIVCAIFVSFPFTYWRLPSIESGTLAFFLLPTRAWELLAGSLLAWFVRRSTSLVVPRVVKLVALLLVVCLIFLPIDSDHPRWNALLVVIATAIMLAGKSEWLPLNRATVSMAKIGDWSYSLYLIHWPLFAFAHNAYLGEVPNHIMLLLFFMSIMLAYMQYEFVEQRFRYNQQANNKRAFQWLAGASLLVILTPVPALVAGYVKSKTNMPDFSYLSLPNVGLHKICSEGKVFVKPEDCSTSGKPTFAVWGDSYAMHLIPGLKTDPRIGNSMIQITKSACAPVLGIASIDSNYDENWAKECLTFNENAVKFFRDNDSIKYVIMSSSFSGYFDHGGLLLFYQGKKTKVDRTIAISQMVATIKELRAIGKHPIVVTPPPRAGFNIGECWERKATGLILLGRIDCNLDIDEYRSYQKGIIDAIKEVQNRTNVDVVWLDGIICDDEHCLTAIDSTSIYRDEGHLTVPGSEWVVPQLNLADRT
ncbi:MAG: acyltransferase family protein [Sulfuricella sp.]